MSPLEAYIRERVALFVAGRLTPAALSDGLPDAWELDRAGEPAVTEMVLFVVGRLSEYHAGDLSRSELCDELIHLTRTKVVFYGEPVVTLLTASSTTQFQPVPKPRPLVEAGT